MFIKVSIGTFVHRGLMSSLQVFMGGDKGSAFNSPLGSFPRVFVWLFGFRLGSWPLSEALQVWGRRPGIWQIQIRGQGGRLSECTPVEGVWGLGL